jgi:hypothetical protein
MERGCKLLLLSAQHFPKHFRQMLRFASRDVLDLLAAGNSGSDDLDVRM